MERWIGNVGCQLNAEERKEVNQCDWICRRAVARVKKTDMMLMIGNAFKDIKSVDGESHVNLMMKCDRSPSMKLKFTYPV